ncbi:copper radical oxidase [Athelia psychrophila]|uniref:Copper radical oxidase n=1 Tax=Athelia psychrophila TaxID=1759441 RepID=A0A166F7V2_9AGAM|nr:copper radical oxidase [Fibularhizoctonia sp. CBS 109695]
MSINVRKLEGLSLCLLPLATILDNGPWMNVGGSQGVSYGGVTLASGNGPYDYADGGKSVRILNPCDNDNCDWETLEQLTTRRWYPTLETLEDGSAISSATSSAATLLIQSNWATVLLDYTAQEEQALQDIPDAVRCYPASGGTAMLPLTPASNWTATVLFCGGSNIKSNGWETPGFNIPQFAASASCVSITPDVSGNYTEEDPLPEGRTMGNLILLPDGTVVNGRAQREHHPADTFYSAYYNKPRPAPQNLPTTLTYGGAYWNLSLTSTDLAGTPANIQNTKVVVIRTGFSTHTINMDVRYVEPDSSYTGNADGSGTLHVAQLPPDAAILASGPALLFVVVDGVPSVAQMIMVGNGKIGKQPTLSAATLPSNATTAGAPTASSSSSGGGGSSSAAVKTDMRWAIGAVAATDMTPDHIGYGLDSFPSFLTISTGP